MAKIIEISLLHQKINLIENRNTLHCHLMRRKHTITRRAVVKVEDLLPWNQEVQAKFHV